MSEFVSKTENQEPVDPNKLLEALNRFKRVVFYHVEEPGFEKVDDDDDDGEDATILHIV